MSTAVAAPQPSDVPSAPRRSAGTVCAAPRTVHRTTNHNGSPRAAPTSAAASPDHWLWRILAVVDLDPNSPTYSDVVGWCEMPNVGDELHHHGWNACSSALCPSNPHPHVERRYLLMMGLRSSRIHFVDVKQDPKNPVVAKIIE